MQFTNNIYVHCKRTIKKIKGHFGFQYEPESCLFMNSYLYSLPTNKDFLKNMTIKKLELTAPYVGIEVLFKAFLGFMLMQISKC